MPPRNKKDLTWKCLKCSFVLVGQDREFFKIQGFEHQVTSHELVSENKDWFNRHMHNYYDIS